MALSLGTEDGMDGLPTSPTCAPFPGWTRHPRPSHCLVRAPCLLRLQTRFCPLGWIPQTPPLLYHPNPTHSQPSLLIFKVTMSRVKKIKKCKEVWRSLNLLPRYPLHFLQDYRALMCPSRDIRMFCACVCLYKHVCNCVCGITS